MLDLLWHLLWTTPYPNKMRQFKIVPLPCGAVVWFVVGYYDISWSVTLSLAF